jgi:ADP-ribose pyrophosphatase
VVRVNSLTFSRLYSDLNMNKKPWKSLEKTVLQETPFPLVREKLRSHTGAELVYTYVPGRHNWVTIFPVTGNKTVLLVRQYRHIWGEFFLELPAGGGNPSEAPILAAQRELQEEVGATSSEWIALPSYRAPGLFAATIHPFLALDCDRIALPQHEDGELMDVLEVPLLEAYQMLEEGQINEASNIIVMLCAKPILQAKGLLV